MGTARFRLVAMLAVIIAPIHITFPVDAAPATTTSGTALLSQCGPTSTNYYDPVTGRYDCQATAILEGTWTGTASFRSQGTVGLITGDASGTVEVHFDGVSVAGGISRVGTLDFSGTVDVVGSTGATVVRLTIVGGSGAFLGATGTVTSNATSLITGGPALYSYYGTWTHPAY